MSGWLAWAVAVALVAAIGVVGMMVQSMMSDDLPEWTEFKHRLGYRRCMIRLWFRQFGRGRR